MPMGTLTAFGRRSMLALSGSVPVRTPVGGIGAQGRVP